MLIIASISPILSILMRVFMKFTKKKIILTTIAIVFLALFVGGYVYFKTPVNYIEGSVIIPGDSYVSRENKLNIASVIVSFPSPVAKIGLANETIEKGVEIFPNIKGTWRWEGQRALYFSPIEDWLPDTSYKITIDKKILDDKVKLRPLEFSFNTLGFTGESSNLEMYENPKNPKDKRITATLNFSHPVDMEDLYKRLTMKTIGGTDYEFKLTQDKQNRKVYVVSEPIQIELVEDFLTLKVKKVKNTYNKKVLENVITDKIKIPSAKTYFQLSSVSSMIVENEEKDNEAEQVLLVNFSTPVAADELARYIDIYYYNNGKGHACYYFNQEKKNINFNVSTLPRLEYETLPLEHDFSRAHAFKYEILDNRNNCIVVVVKKELTSVDEFTFSETETRAVNVVEFPTEMKIAFDGSLLSLKGDKNLSFISRGVKKIEVDIARIDSSNINHLISQTHGDFSNPRFNDNFTADNIAENFKEVLSINSVHPAVTNYSSVDLSKYFQNKKGIFIAEVKGYKNKDDHYESKSDKRLILVTDIGLIVKDNTRGEHDLFVLNFRTGKPIAGANIDVLGKNGIPILSTRTGWNGVAKLPSFKDFKREKTPVAYLVTKGQDISYMPISASDRKLDYSRFDVSGNYQSYKNEKLKAFMFTDRGIYRPSETAYFGLIVRDNDLGIPVKNQLIAKIYDSYSDEVYVKNIEVDEYGFIDLSFKLSDTARTGQYSLQLSVKDERGHYDFVNSLSFKVEEFMPDTMKIRSKIIGAPHEGWMWADKLEAMVNLDNLYGNPAISHDVKAQFNLVPTSFRFSKYKDFRFVDPKVFSRQNRISIHENLDTIKTNEKGEATFHVDLSSYTKGMYRFNLSAQGMEKEGGRSVYTNTNVLISPLEYLVGSKADGALNYINKDSKRQISFIAVNPELEAIDLSNLQLQIVKKQYVSALVAQPNGTFKYQSIAKENLLKTNEFAISKDGTAYMLDTSTPGDFYIKIVASDNTVLSRIDYSVAGRANLAFSLEKSALLDLTLNKSEYNHGEEIKISMKAPYTGYGLITIEQDGVYAYKWFKVDSLSSVQSIVLPDTIEGNAYINVALVRDMDSSEIFTSPLSYGVANFNINMAKRTIAIDLETPALVKPGNDLVIKYKTSQPGKIIIYGVNEGILQVADYKLPNALSFFFHKKALQVATYQILDLILPDNKILQNIKRTGGDDYDQVVSDLMEGLNPFARKLDKPVTFWSGVIDTYTDESSYSYKVPATFNGQIRVMAISADKASFGRTSTNVIVRGDFAMSPTAPFNVSPGDRFEVGTSVANMVEDSRSLPVQLELVTPKNMVVSGDNTARFDLAEKDETSSSFIITAGDKLGTDTLVFAASSGNYESKMPISIGVRPATAYQTDLKSDYVKRKVELKNFIVPMYEEYRQQYITASSSPLVLAGELIKYLDKYPHSCTEQTVSKVFPMMAVLFKYPELLGDADVYGLFDDTMSKLRVRQNNGGGFSSWTVNGAAVDDFSTIYATHFLIYAKKHDFNVPSNMINRALKYMKNNIASETPTGYSDATNIAYSIYVLTLNGEITTNYLINLEKYLDETYKKEWRSQVLATYMAASYSMLKNGQKAQEILGYYKLGQNDLDDARHIYLLANYFPNSLKSIELESVESLLRPLKEDRYNSINSAYAVLALAAYNTTEQDDKNIKFSVDGATYDTFARLDIANLALTTPVDISSNKPFYYVVTQQGFGKNLPDSAHSEGVEVHKEFYNANGEKVTTGKLGEEITVRLRIKSSGRDSVNDVALVDIIAGCFEIIGNSITTDRYVDYTESREDRVLTYLTVTSDIATISYKVNVIAAGDFIVPPVTASALYDTTVRANSKPSRISIVE